ncbi:MAG: M23 family metallopeptidase [Dehalococcoidia bacterium]|nr:MAG: M23 family metallopeptidase [Dehalococcoidia bacterium]
MAKIAAPTLAKTINRRYCRHTILLVTLIAATLLAAWPGSRAIIQGDFAAQVPVSPVTPSEQTTSDSYRDGYLRATVLLTTETGLGPIDVLAASASPQIPPVEEPVQAVETPEPAVEVTPVPEEAYFTYVVQQGDTAASIAARHGLQLESLLWNNPELRTDPDLLLIGQEMTIPTRDGILYTVKLGDTLLDIADIYQADVENIVGLSSNEIGDADHVLEGAVLLLPGAVPPPPPPPVVAPEPFFAASAPEDAPLGGDFSPPPPAASSGVGGFMWPVVGTFNDYFGAARGGGTYHSGIDLGAASGAPIAAAAGGQVVLASAGYGYGNYVVIRHDDGSETLYAHLSEIWVVQGQWVTQGATIGTVGATGWATGPHLHFEVRVGGAAVDPLYYLP